MRGVNVWHSGTVELLCADDYYPFDSVTLTRIRDERTEYWRGPDGLSLSISSVSLSSIVQNDSRSMSSIRSCGTAHLRQPAIVIAATGKSN